MEMQSTSEHLPVTSVEERVGGTHLLEALKTDSQLRESYGRGLSALDEKYGRVRVQQINNGDYEIGLVIQAGALMSSNESLSPDGGKLPDPTDFLKSVGEKLGLDKAENDIEAKVE